MKKLKAATLVLTVMVFLSLASAASPKFFYFLAYEPRVGGTCVGGACPPATVGGGGAPIARVGSNGLDRYFNFLASLGILGLAPF
jgi:hypothetical protein